MVKSRRSSVFSKKSRESNKSKGSSKSRKSREFRVVIDEESEMKEISNKIAREIFTP